MDKKERTSAENGALAQITALYVLFLLLIGFFPFQLPGGSLVSFRTLFGGGLDFWGITLYEFGSPLVKVAATLLMLLVLAPKMNWSVSCALSKIYSRISGILANKRAARYMAYLAVPIIFFIAFCCAHDKAIGATGVFEDMLDKKLMFIGSNPLSTYLNYVFFSAAKETSSGLLYDLSENHRQFIRLISNISGFFYVLLLVRLSDDLFPGIKKKAVFFSFLAFQGYMFLFFYDHDTHPQQLVFLLTYVYFSIRYLRGSCSIALPAFFLSVSALMHMMSYVFLPSLFILPLLSQDDRGPAGARKERYPVVLRAFDSIFTREFLLIVFYLVLPLIIFWLFILSPNSGRSYGGAYGDLLGGGDGRMFLPLFQAESRFETYTMFSWKNASEKINSLLFLCPMTLLLGFLFMIKYRKDAASDSVQRFMRINFFLGFLFIFMWSADYGVKLDWNLFSPAAFMMSVPVAYYLADRTGDEYIRYISSIAIFYSVMHLLTLLS